MQNTRHYLQLQQVIACGYIDIINEMECSYWFIKINENGMGNNAIG